MTDALKLYMRELVKCSPISREEEHELAVRYASTKDPQAGRRLVQSNMRFVVAIASQLKRPRHDLLDLIQEGNCGLMRALIKYDPQRGIRFTTYASWWIRAYILNYIVGNWHLIRLGKSQSERRLFFAIEREKKKLELRGQNTGIADLARALGVSEKEVAVVETRMTSAASLDTSVVPGSDADRSLHNVLAVESEKRPDLAVERTELRVELMVRLFAFGETLSGREAEIFQERMMADEPAKLEELAARYGITRERVRQIEVRVRNKLRESLLDSMDEGTLAA